MIFEIINPEQSMDVFRYIVEKDYNCETSDSAYDLVAKQDAKYIFEIMEERYEDIDDDENEEATIYQKYARKDKDKLEKYIITKLIEDIEDYDQGDYNEYLSENALIHLQEYDIEESKNKE